jgi:ribonuclease HI
MLGHQHTPSASNRQRQPRQQRNQLRICWANVGRSSPCHITILEAAFQKDMDVVCVQEPFTCANSRTSTHPGFRHLAPISTWDAPNALGATRPRVMTYIRKGCHLKLQARQSLDHPDLLWAVVNGVSILNCYRQPLTPDVLQYVTHLTPPQHCVVGGDFNVRHESFEPSVSAASGGIGLARWAANASMDYIGVPGQPTHCAGHVLDLTFSNIPFAQSAVDASMHCGSDHETIVTSVSTSTLGTPHLDQHHYRVPEASLPKFTGLVEIGVQSIPDPRTAQDAAQLDNCVTLLTETVQHSIQTAGKLDRKEGRAAPWWTQECKTAYQAYKHARQLCHGSLLEERHAFKTTVRQAKRQYWRHVIDNAKDDKDLFKIIAWHKLTPENQDTPLIVNNTTISDPLEKAEALREEVLNRYTAEDDLGCYPDQGNAATLPWSTHISLEEAERNTIGVSSTSPGTDRSTVRLLRACWAQVGQLIRRIFQRCLELNHFPAQWKLAEVAMIPKVGKKDRTSPRSWRPIALLSCIGKGLERTVARRIAWTAMTHKILSPQHGGALPKRSAVDLTAAFTHDTEAAWAKGQHVTMVTLDVQGAFDALLKNRLLHRMAEQGWPQRTILFVNSFLTDRRVQVRLGRVTTPSYPVACGTPQGSPLSPVLYTLYLAELLSVDTKRRFGYADDICLYQASHSLDENVQLLAADLRQIRAWGTANKVTFAPEKQEMIHLTRQKSSYAPPCVVDEQLTINPILPSGSRTQPALRWLGIWFYRKLTFKRHVATHNAKAAKVAYHIRSLANTAYGPPASSLRKATMACVYPSLLYGAECWYRGRTKPPRTLKPGRPAEVSTYVGWHIAVMDKTLAIAARGILPVWRTTPTATLFRDAGLLSAATALEEAKLRFATHLRTVDAEHPLARRTAAIRMSIGRSAGKLQRMRTKVQYLGSLLPEIPRTILTSPHYSPGCQTDPTMGTDKKTAAKAFKGWWAQLPPLDVTIFSEGSEQYTKEGEKRVTYGFAVYQDGKQLHTGRGSLHPTPHVFDAEAVGAWRGLQHTIRQPALRTRRIWLCIDSTSVIWCLRGNAPSTSQWAFLECHGAMETHDVSIKWAPGHLGIEGNEAADRLANLEAQHPSPPTGKAAMPTLSGIKTVARKVLHDGQQTWWSKKKGSLSTWYKRWELGYSLHRRLPELDLPRAILARLLAIRSMHGDFAWYHRKFSHNDATLTCSCGRDKTPEHLALCRKTLGAFGRWPLRPSISPSSRSDGLAYTAVLIGDPEAFEAFTQLTQYYTRVCPR